MYVKLDTIQIGIPRRQIMFAIFARRAAWLLYGHEIGNLVHQKLSRSL